MKFLSFFFLFLQAAATAKQTGPLILPIAQRTGGSRGLKSGEAGGAATTSSDLLLFDLSIGTPPQRFTLSVESAQVWSWALDSSCPNVTGDQHTYESSKSSTSSSGPHGLYCSSASFYTYCRFWDDIVEVSGGDTPFSWNQTFGSAMLVEDPTTYAPVRFPADGVLGLSWTLEEGRRLTRAKEDEQTDPSEVLIVNLLTNFEHHVFTVWIGARPPAGQSANNALLTIGGIDWNNCEPPLNYVPLNLDEFSQLIDIQGFRVGSFETRRRRSAQLSSGHSALVLEQQAYEASYLAIKPDYDWTNQLFTVDCERVSSLPDLIFTIASVDYAVSGRQYVLDIGLADGKCAVMVALSDDDNAHYVLGLPFLRERCTVYAVDQQRVGLAQGHKQ